MGRVGLKGYLGQFAHYAEATPVLDWICAQIENALNGQIDSTNIAVGGIATANYADLSITAPKLLLNTLTSAQMADGVGQTTSGSYTGDGVTVSRTITLTFTPRWVEVIRTDATFIEFRSIQNSGVTTNWYRDAAGAMAALTTNWQGIVTNGFQLGTNAAGTSNVAAVVYRYVAFK